MDSTHTTHRGHALRSGRTSEPGRAYLLTSVTADRQVQNRHLEEACV